MLHSDRAGAVYADISGISALPKGMTACRPENQPLYFNLVEAIDLAKKMGHDDINWPSELPPWVQKVCASAEEYVAFRGGASDDDNQDAPKKIGAVINGNDDSTTEVPF